MTYLKQLNHLIISDRLAEVRFWILFKGSREVAK